MKHADSLMLAELAAQLGVLSLEHRGAALAALTDLYGEEALLARALNLTRQLLGRYTSDAPLGPHHVVALAEGFSFDPDPVGLYTAALAVCDPDCPDEVLAALEVGAVMCCFVGAAAACILAEDATPAEFLAAL